MNTIRASDDATPSKQFNNPLNVTRFNPSYADFCCDVSSRDANAASMSSNSMIDCSGATLKSYQISNSSSKSMNFIITLTNDLDDHRLVLVHLNLANKC